ncbi:MAG: 4-hydroxy-tetrahydrodipicolinate reductase [Candidatus Cloacimonetes bacterium]|nr:4-hydroxy-tetrahydrodipicolinate reductase [Candidatus Cloacimonadota bacterium]
MPKTEVILFPTQNVVKKTTINLFLVGFGKMGKIISENAHYITGDIVAIYDPNIPEYCSLDRIDFDNIDVAIEFTHPESGYDNVKMLLDLNIPVVTGTTGWFHRVKELERLYNPEKHSLIYGANFSIGMNLMYKIVEESAKLINNTNLYDVYGFESHHRGKIDSPSGTAKVLADIILENNSSKDKAIYDLNNKTLKANEFSFSSIRAGNIVGYHEIGFDSDFDEIKLVHNAKNRRGFALGALMAAKYAKENKGFLNFKDIFRYLYT